MTACAPREQAGWVIGVQVDLSHPLHCAAGQPCPRSGIWVVEPRTLNAAVRAFDERLAQTYVEQGQIMPHPQQGWLEQTPEHLRLTAADFEWLWLGFANTREADQQLHINVPTSASSTPNTPKT